MAERSRRRKSLRVSELNRRHDKNFALTLYEGSELVLAAEVCKHVNSSMVLVFSAFRAFSRLMVTMAMPLSRETCNISYIENKGECISCVGVP